jgi:hypothetical protein
VAHGGTSIAGSFIHTLTMVEVAQARLRAPAVRFLEAQFALIYLPKGTSSCLSGLQEPLDFVGEGCASPASI